jgi:riboflavin kinase/FMN adenylyltransferase
MENVKALLGRQYSISGKVVEGNKLGRILGFPTANISLSFTEKLVPKTGVYAVLVKVGQNHYQGMMNIGYRPTISESALTLEVHIFDFTEDIYNQSITVFFVQYLRDEQKFASVEDLKKQLHADKELAVSLLRKEVVL